MWRVATVLWALAACGGGEPVLECIQVDPQCAPLYVPTFQNVWSMTLDEKCATGRGCHTNGGMKGGMTFEDIDVSYQLLLDPEQERAIPFDAGCSIMIIRTNSTDPDIMMPPGGQLLPAERCSLIQWVAMGAMR